MILRESEEVNQLGWYVNHIERNAFKNSAMGVGTFKIYRSPRIAYVAVANFRAAPEKELNRVAKALVCAAAKRMPAKRNVDGDIVVAKPKS